MGDKMGAFQDMVFRCFGWQGGTIHQAEVEIRRLQRIANAAKMMVNKPILSRGPYCAYCGMEDGEHTGGCVWNEFYHPSGVEK